MYSALQFDGVGHPPSSGSGTVGEKPAARSEVDVSSDDDVVVLTTIN